MSYRYLLFALAILLTASCITEGNYSTKLGATFCKKYQECEPGEFDAEYDSISDCKSQANEFSGSDSGDCLTDAGCKFDGSAAKACRSAIADSTCGEDLGSVFVGACADIYNCDDADNSAVAACFSTQ